MNRTNAITPDDEDNNSDTEIEMTTLLHDGEGLVLSCLCVVLSCLILSYPVLLCRVFLCSGSLSFLVLSYHVLCCLCLASASMAIQGTFLVLILPSSCLESSFLPTESKGETEEAASFASYYHVMFALLTSEVRSCNLRTVLSCLAMVFGPVLSCLVLSCPVLSCLV